MNVFSSSYFAKLLLTAESYSLHFPDYYDYFDPNRKNFTIAMNLIKSKWPAKKCRVVGFLSEQNSIRAWVFKQRMSINQNL